MDDTQKDGSDSDWDSTLDFTSPRQVGAGQFLVRHVSNEAEIEEESSLSDESDLEAAPDLPSEKHVIRNELAPQVNAQGKSRSPSPARKENNLVLAQKQQNQQRGRQMRDQQRDATTTQKKGNNQKDPEPPPYNFREAITDQATPEPAARGPPGKDRKGMTYDPGPSPTPRGKPVQQGSIRSIGSWDDSDPDERTLRELRMNYQQEKQKEERKMKETEASEAKSVAEEAPQTARSETTWRSWAGGKRGKKNKAANQNNAAAAQTTPTTARSQATRPQTASVTMPTNTPRIEVVPPQETLRSQPPVDVYDQRYQPPVMPVAQPAVVPPPQLVQSSGMYTTQYATAPPTHAVDTEDVELMEDPKQLVMRDEDAGRYVYYFGHGKLRYFEVNEEYEEAVLPGIADKVDRIMQRVWKEFFAILRIIFSIIIWFVVELFRFFAHSVFQPLILGIFVTIGDFVIKPLLSAIFNGIMQPFSIFLWNVFTGLRHMFGPFGEILHRVLEQVAMLCRSIRLFEVNWVSGQVLPQHQYQDIQQQQQQQQRSRVHNI